MPSDAVRRWGRGRLFPVVTSLTARGLAMARPLLGGSAPVQPWRSGGPVLVVAPHPDDETVGAGAAILAHLAAGDRVTVVAVTDGRASRAGGMDGEAMAVQRQREFQLAMARLGATGIWIGAREGEWNARRMRALLRPLVLPAALLYAPTPVDFHPEHLRVAAVVAALVRGPQRVRGMELGVPLTPRLTNLYLTGERTAGQRRHVLDAYRSQGGALDPLERARHYREALYGTGEGEPFWEMSAAAYRTVTALGPRSDQDSPFRGFRPRPFSDVRSYLQGGRLRRRLRQAAQRSEESSRV